MTNRVFYDSDCIGIGGLNIDPYTTDRKIGRVRHLYVSKKYRNKGIGKLLLNKIIKSSKGSFEKLRLYTENPIARTFYQNNGFKKSSANKQSHYIEVKDFL